MFDKRRDIYFLITSEAFVVRSTPVCNIRKTSRNKNILLNTTSVRLQAMGTNLSGFNYTQFRVVSIYDIRIPI